LLSCEDIRLEILILDSFLFILSKSDKDILIEIKGYLSIINYLLVNFLIIVVKKNKGTISITIELGLENVKIMVVVLYEKGNSLIFDTWIIYDFDLKIVDFSFLFENKQSFLYRSFILRV